jgi:hypothetical protein
MSGRLFAFRLAKPVDPIEEEISIPLYDPQTQKSVWYGQPSAQLYLYCTRRYGCIPACSCRRSCNAYGNYCTKWGNCSSSGWIVYKCDTAV